MRADADIAVDGAVAGALEVVWIERDDRIVRGIAKRKTRNEAAVGDLERRAKAACPTEGGRAEQVSGAVCGQTGKRF